MSTDETAETDANYLTVEVGEFKNKRSLRRFHDVYDMVDDTFDEAYALFAKGKIQSDGRNIRLLKAVQRYIRTVYPLFMEYSRDLEEQYADKHDDIEAEDVDANETGSQPVNRYWAGGRAEDTIGTIQMDHRDPIIFNGLRDIMEADEIYTENWTERVQNRHVGDNIERHTQSYTVPAWVSEAAFNKVTLFLTEERDVIGLDFADEDHQTEITRELLEEVDEWRRKNVN